MITIVGSNIHSLGVEFDKAVTLIFIVLFIFGVLVRGSWFDLIHLPVGFEDKVVLTIYCRLVELLYKLPPHLLLYSRSHHSLCISEIFPLLILALLLRICHDQFAYKTEDCLTSLLPRDYSLVQRMPHLLLLLRVFCNVGLVLAIYPFSLLSIMIFFKQLNLYLQIKILGPLPALVFDSDMDIVVYIDVLLLNPFFKVIPFLFYGFYEFFAFFF